MYLWAGDRPSKGVLFATILVVVGAFLAAFENFDSNLIGFTLVWGYNFTSSFQSVYLSVLNKEKVLSPMEFNFYFACIGFVSTAFYNFILTSDYT